MTTDPAPHAFAPHPGFPDQLCVTCGWWPGHPLHSLAGVPILAEVPDHAEPSFDYAQLERRMWERVEDQLLAYGATANALGLYPKHRPVNYGPAADKLRAAIRSWGFAYRLAKEDAMDPAERARRLAELLP